jgi:hypothetical protein
MGFNRYSPHSPNRPPIGACDQDAQQTSRIARKNNNIDAEGLLSLPKKKRSGPCDSGA